MPKFTVGQVWLTPDGMVYEIEAKESAGWRVAIRRYKGKHPGEVTASAKPWYFTDDQLAHQAKAKKFELYNDRAVARIDELSSRLEQNGKVALAHALDAIGYEYSEGMLVRKCQRLKVERAEDQLETLKHELKTAQDPEVIEELSDQIKDAARTVQTYGPRVSPGNPVAPMPTVTKPLKPTAPKFVSKV
jgi:exonuclease VII small subunit